MIKIINNAVITKCGECPRYKEAGYWDTNDIFHYEMACDQDGTPVFVNPDPIDKDCPLASCEVIDILEGKDKIVRIEYGYNGCAFEANKISHIIIVKKPTTADKVEGEKTNG
jgi:hypothetical protein